MRLDLQFIHNNIARVLHEFMNDSKSYTQGSRCYEKLKTMDHMKESMSLSQGSSCNEKLKDVDDMNNSGLGAQGSRCYE